MSDKGKKTEISFKCQGECKRQCCRSCWAKGDNSVLLRQSLQKNLEVYAYIQELIEASDKVFRIKGQPKYF